MPFQRQLSKDDEGATEPVLGSQTVIYFALSNIHASNRFSARSSVASLSQTESIISFNTQKTGIFFVCAAAAAAATPPGSSFKSCGCGGGLLFLWASGNPDAGWFREGANTVWMQRPPPPTRTCSQTSSCRRPRTTRRLLILQQFHVSGNLCLGSMIKLLA